MGFLSILGGAVIKEIANGLFGKIEAGWEAYMKKEISRDQLLEKMQEALLSTFAEVEKTYADSITKSFSTFMEAASKSRLMQAVWASVALSQLFVLFWYQWVVPALVTWGWVNKYASAGATVDWAYALLMFCLGGGAIALKSGPGSGSLKDQLKSLVGMK